MAAASLRGLQLPSGMKKGWGQDLPPDGLL
jgi:hypothetical protein